MSFVQVTITNCDVRFFCFLRLVRTRDYAIVLTPLQLDILSLSYSELVYFADKSCVWHGGCSVGRLISSNQCTMFTTVAGVNKSQ